MFEELPEGLSGESAKRVEGEVSSEVTPSTLGAHLLPRINRSWKALSYFSKIGQDDIDRIRCRYQIPYDVVLRIPDSDKRACSPKYEGDVAFYEADLRAGLCFPMQPFVRELLDFLSLAPGQVAPNGWRTIISCMVMWRVNSNGQEDLTVDGFLFCYEPCQIALSPGFGRLRIMMPILGSSRGCLRLIGSGRTGTSSCVVTTGRGFHKRILGILSKFVGRGGLFRHLVCVFFFFFFFYFYVFVHCQCMTCFIFFCSVGSSIVKFCVEGEDIKNLGDRESSIHRFH